PGAPSHVQPPPPTLSPAESGMSERSPLRPENWPGCVRTQTPPVHVPPAHGEPFGRSADPHAPEVGSHTPTWQTSSAGVGHDIATSPEHLPAWQVSAFVQTLPSSQEVPSFWNWQVGEQQSPDVPVRSPSSQSSPGSRCPSPQVKVAAVTSAE